MTETPIRFAVDLNILGALGLLVYGTKEDYKNFVPNGDKIRQDLKFLDDCIKYDNIELIVPFTVMKGMRPKNPEANLPDYKLDKVKRQETYKRFAKIYMNKMPNIKVAFFGDGYVKDYLDAVEVFAKLYSEEPTDLPAYSIPFDERTKPFTYHNNNLAYPALKMAEATLLGLDFLSLNNQYFLKKPVHVAKTIKSLNKETINSTVKPLALDEAVEILSDLEKTEKYIEKTEKQPKVPSPKFLPYKAFKYKVHKVYKEKQSFKEINQTRTLFLKYLTDPIDLENLEPQTDNLEK